MKKLVFILAILLLANANEIFAHKRAKYNIIIDTDAGIDDFRAITYFMASGDFNINCITTVDGILDPITAVNYISLLQKKYHHEGIPLGAGELTQASKKYTGHALPIWEQLFPDIEPAKINNAIELLDFSIKNENKKTIFVCLGPLTNIAGLLKKYPENNPKIEMILWFSEWDGTPEGYNYNQDKEAYKFITDNKIPLKIVTSSEFAYESDFCDICKEINSVYAQQISDFFCLPDSQKVYYWDELLPLYLLHPTLFTEERVSDFSSIVQPIKENHFDFLVSGLLNSNKPQAGVVYNELPTSGFMLINDVDVNSEKLVEKHGYPEFKIVSLTSEIHSHMGVYSILGAKTGLRIMEYLHAGLDEIEIISYAGFDPPISCFNDGLQVGTGSTIGYGTISVDTSKTAQPSVLVKYNRREILFSIKPEIASEVTNDVSQLVKKHGLDSEMYWIKLRELSITKYWLGMSRFDILQITEIK